GNHLGVERVICDEHFLDASKLCRRLGGSAAILSRDEHVHGRTKLRSSCDGLRRRVLERGVDVFCNHEARHQMTPASFLSLSRSSCTVFTLMPAWRFGGSVTLRTFSFGVMSTPKSAGDFSSIGFFFAFMMFGNEA